MAATHRSAQQNVNKLTETSILEAMYRGAEGRLYVAGEIMDILAEGKP